MDTQLLFFLFLAETHPMKASSSLNREICALPLSFNHSSEMQLLTSDINFLDRPPHIVGFWSGPNPVRGAGKASFFGRHDSPADGQAVMFLTGVLEVFV